MQTVEKKSSSNFGLNLNSSLGLVRCFNTAAFVALSAFYFGMFCLGKPVIKQVELMPPFHGAASAMTATVKNGANSAPMSASTSTAMSVSINPSFNSAI